jgi:hypothetical protein
VAATDRPRAGSLGRLKRLADGGRSRGPSAVRATLLSYGRERASRRKSLLPGDPLTRRSRDSVAGASTASTVSEMFRMHVVLDAVIYPMTS